MWEERARGIRRELKGSSVDSEGATGKARTDFAIGLKSHFAA